MPFDQNIIVLFRSQFQLNPSVGFSFYPQRWVNESFLDNKHTHILASGSQVFYSHDSLRFINMSYYPPEVSSMKYCWVVKEKETPQRQYSGHNIPLGQYTDHGPRALGQYNCLGSIEYSMIFPKV